jgi:hypothetical protein
MKIRLAVVDNDQKYAERLLKYYSNRYSEKLELSYFTTFELFKENLISRNIDAVLVSEKCNERLEAIKDRMVVAYFTEALSIDSIHGIKAICKYQKPDLIYKEILRLFSEYDSSSIAYKVGENDKTIIEVFMPVNGGAGASTMAVTHAKKLAAKGIRTLYLGLEKLSSTDYFFQGEGNGSFEDVIYAVKSHKPNLALKLESLVQQDASGVYFFAGSKNAMDVLELKDEDVAILLDELQALSNYERIIVDTDNDLKNRLKILSKAAYRLLMVAEHTEIGIRKLEAVSQIMMLMESDKQIDISTKLTVICNKANDNKALSYDGQIPIREYIAFCNGKTSHKVVEQLMRLPILEGKRSS